ncbi:MAG: hypothetical protein AAFY25_11980 [Pseudomonadota bacterium]
MKSPSEGTTFGRFMLHACYVKESNDAPEKHEQMDRPAPQPRISIAKTLPFHRLGHALTPSTWEVGQGLFTEL